MSTTFYSGKNDGYGGYVRAKCVYDITTSNRIVKVAGTVYLQHYGAAWSGMLDVYATASLNGETAETSKFSSLAKHSSWTDVASKSFSVNIAKGHSATTKTLKIASGWLPTLDENAASKSISVPARPSYAVTYNANGGSGAPGSQTKWYNEDLTLSSTKPTRTNYVFKSWNTKADGSGTTYQPGATYSTDAAVTLYAQWYAPYSVTYDGNATNVSGVPASQVKVYNKALTLSSNVPSRANYRFMGWDTKAAGTGTRYSPGATYSTNANLALYAQWRRLATIDSLTAIRGTYDSSTGTFAEDDEGSYAQVTVTWEYSDSASTGTVSGTYQTATGTGTAISGWSTTGSGTSAAPYVSTAVIAADPSFKYLVTVTITNSIESTATVTKTVILTGAQFMLDFKAGGGAIGIGCPAPDDGMEVAFATEFTDESTTARQLVSVAEDIDRDSAYPTADQWHRPLQNVDADGDVLTMWRTVRRTNGRVELLFSAYNDGNVENTLRLGVADDGTCLVGVSDASVWRTALGAQQAIGHTTTTVSATIAANGQTLVDTTVPSGRSACIGACFHMSSATSVMVVSTGVILYGTSWRVRLQNLSSNSNAVKGTMHWYWI